MRYIKLRYIKFIIIQLVFLLIFQINSYAAYVGSPNRIFKPANEEKAFSVYTEAIADMIYDRGAKDQTDDTEVNFYGGTAGLIYKNYIALYAGAGAAYVEEVYTIANNKIKWASDYGFTWLVGCTFKIYEREIKDFYNSKLLFSLDWQYRNTDLDPETITIDSTEYSIPNSSISYPSMEYNDWHAALTCGLDMGMFLPYLGIKYSDFESCVRVMKEATLYQKDNAEADENFGIFAGVGVKITDSLHANIEASIIDEIALSGSASWRF